METTKEEVQYNLAYNAVLRIAAIVKEFEQDMKATYGDEEAIDDEWRFDDDE